MRQTNADERAPGGIHEDHISFYDRLPPEVRHYMANSICCWNSIQAAQIVRDFGVEVLLKMLVTNDRQFHDLGVQRKIVPRVKGYRFEFRTDRKPDSTCGVRSPESKGSAGRVRFPPKKWK